MSTLDRSKTKTLPALVEGERLDQPTFHERYEAMPPGQWAELIDGEVHMPSPVFDDHGGTGDVVSYWLGHYRRRTPGLRSAANVTTILGVKSEVQPDHQLRIMPEHGGAAQLVGGFVHGPPELVVEISRSSKPIDLGRKKSDYLRAGVREYIVVESEPNRIHWFVLRQGGYHEQTPGPDGLLRSQVFPGLWLDPVALYADNLDAIATALELGMATPEHAAFAARLSGSGGK